MRSATDSKWRFNGVRVVRADDLDIAAAITYARAGAEKLDAMADEIGTRGDERPQRRIHDAHAFVRFAAAPR